ncbi:MAG TPA: hypothetical protein VIF62_16235 [Labilithrix sp.]|jgi:hypothetical protein
MNARALRAPFALACVLVASPSAAQSQCVALHEAGDTRIGASVAEQLRIALASRQIALCTDESAAPLATLDLALDDAKATLTLTVRDAVTNKRVARDVELASIPGDARALVVAQAADELLRASWAELLVADAPKPQRAVPIEVARAVDETVVPPKAPPHAPIVELAAGASADAYTGSRASFGPDAAVTVLPWPRVGFRARFGLRLAPRASAGDGDVDTTATAFALGALFGVLPRAGPFGLDAIPELAATRFVFDARGSNARSDASTSVYANLAAQGWWAVAPPLHAGVALAAGAPLHAVRAVDVDRTLAGAAGALLSASVFVAGAF